MLQKLLGTRHAFSRAAWLFVLYLIGVILFGAWVRITHSGAGCGSHWPTCHGEIIPLSFSAEKAIEYTHRLTSGLCGIFGLILLAWARIRYGAGRVFRGMAITLFFIILEGAIGAGLVLKELVASDSSRARALVISLHLVNTLMLTGIASLTAWWSAGKPMITPSQVPARKWGPVLVGMFLLILTCISGAITALGDTLFPVDPTAGTGLFTQVSAELDATNHFLVRLRVMHPVVAVLTAAYTLWLASFVASRVQLLGQPARLWALMLGAATALQVLMGLLNIMLAAPGWLQLSHLFMAQAVWIAITLMGASILAHHRSPTTTTQR